MVQNPLLVILAAGRGSRYGGLKQLEPVGPGGGAILDYTVYDAIRAGFGSVILVVSRESEGPVRDASAQRFGRRVPVRLVRQRMDDLPDGFALPDSRVKPWGTGHAVLAARDAVDRPFAVVNADDLYGAAAMETLGRFLSGGSDAGAPEFAMVGYRLGETLSGRGTVSRALCRCAKDGRLEEIEEIPAIAGSGDGGAYEDAGGLTRQVNGEALVSMNIWGFTPCLFPPLRAAFESFLECSGGSATEEFYLSSGINRLIARGEARVTVLGGAGRWCGITHPGDRPRVMEVLSRLTDEGVYPRELWT